jgi:hypothetical protein
MRSTVAWGHGDSSKSTTEGLHNRCPILTAAARSILDRQIPGVPCQNDERKPAFRPDETDAIPPESQNGTIPPEIQEKSGVQQEKSKKNQEELLTCVA